MITVVAVAEALRPWVGSSVLSQLPDLCAWTVGALKSWRDGEPFAQRARLIESALFLSVRRVSGGDMCVALDSGRVVRMQVSDFTALADELMFLLFDSLPLGEYTYELLNDYAMTSGSLSAMHVLYLDYGDRYSDAELAALIRVIRGYPAFRWRGWLNE